MEPRLAGWLPEAQRCWLTVTESDAPAGDIGDPARPSPAADSERWSKELEAATLALLTDHDLQQSEPRIAIRQSEQATEGRG